ncbi:MAG: hypothetical protein QOE06_3652, partial [Thermoleophilaceae bacterium]|nr:hypothetical protein [Thermoleophilaceae bacterium]
LTFLPNPGGDLTYVAQTAPGVVMNTQATAGPSYGTFSAFGLPGTANLFTINGQNNNDPYFNVNNSGASNLLLGQNEISEATVVSNPYSAQYGQLAGAQVNYVTKSGNNQLHGDAIWWWNGRILNANNFFSNASGIARPFDNVNQWAASVGGPVRKDRTFFFANYEGLRMVFPSSPVLVQIPSPQFQSAVLANLTATGRASSVPFYQQGFAVYNGAPGAGTGTPISGGGCTGLPASALTALAGAPCILQFRAAAPARAREYQYAVRVDHQISTNDRAYVRIWRDNGTQPSYTDPLNPLLSSVSTQPQMAGNLNETHTFGSSMVNEFVLAGLYYSAAFGPANLGATTSLFPTTFSVSGNPFYPLGYETNLYPQGRRVTQYQVIDNLSKVIRSHTFRMGFNFVRNDISELGLATGFTGTLTAGSLAEFYAGGGPLSNLQQVFPNRTEAPLALYNLGMYFQDDWKVSSHLTVNIGFRAEHNSNPVCQQDCFSNLTLPFNKLPHDVNQPYNQVIESNRHQAYTYLDAVNWSPRIGFAWNPGGHKTVIRGGAGIMYNALPALLAQRTLSNTPLVNNLTVTGGALAPGAANGLWAQAAQANQQFLTGFASGATLGQIQAGNPAFVPPIYVTTAGLQTPQYQEWNLELQRELPFDMVFSANYVGNHGIHGLIRNWNVNAYCPPTTCGGATFLPPAPPDPRFGELRNYETAAVSRYNGLVLSLRRRLAAGFQFGFNYTWSHSLDEVSNGGELPFDYTLSFLSIRIPEDPRNWRKYNYGNSDYDVRHYISANYVWDDVVRHLYRHGPKMLMGGWTIAGTIFYRTGLPFSVVDTGPRNALTRFNYDPNGAIMATELAPGISTCARSA